MQSLTQFVLVGRANTPGLGDTLTAIGEWLQAQGGQVCIDADSAASLDVCHLPKIALEDAPGRAQAAIVVGGDGTLLGAARVLAPLGVPLIGINHGRLGFMTDVPLRDWQPALGSLLGGNYSLEARSMFDCQVRRENAGIWSALALNDVVVQRGAAGGMLEFVVRIDGDLVYQQRADALIVSTPTGSTAYAMSAGGPMLHPSLAGITLVPVAPQSLSNRPIVLPADVTLDIEVVAGKEMAAHCDMQTFSTLELGDVVRVTPSRHRLQLLHPPGYDYFATLRRKLHWNLMPS
jgi:NAD+ kinase